MALRDKLTERVQPFLPGEQVQQIFLGQTRSPYRAMLFGGGLLGGLLAESGNQRRIIAVTDQAVVVFSTNFNGTKPNSVVARLPRQTQIGPHKGIWARITIGDEKLRVHAKFRKDIKAADAAAGFVAA